MTDYMGEPDLRQRARHALERSQNRGDAHIEQVPDAATVQLLEAALEEMPRRTREIFMAARFDNMPHGNIAKVAGLSVAAVERHMAKAIGQLHHALTHSAVPQPLRP